MDVSDAENWTMCDGCFHQYDTDKYDHCQNEFCSENPQRRLVDIVEEDDDGR